MRERGKKRVLVLKVRFINTYSEKFNQRGNEDRR